MKRLDNPTRPEHIVSCDRLSHSRIRIETSVPAHRHRDGGKLLALCTEFVHVASGDRGMDGRSSQQTKGLFKVLVAVSQAAVSRLESPGCLLVSQHANNGGAKTRHNGHDCMRDHSDGSGSADG